MKKFLIKYFLFLCLVFILLNLWLFGLSGENDFIKPIIDKHRLLENSPSPRIIFIGGSGINLGINSQIVKDKLNLNPINMGLFAQFGLRYMLNEVKPNIRKNDVIVIIPEYHHFFYFFNGWRGLIELIYVYPKSLHYLTSYKQFIVILKRFPAFFEDKVKTIQEYFEKRIIKLLDKEPISNDLYNEYCDYIGHLKSNKTFNVSEQRVFNTSEMSFEDEAINELNNFYSFANKIGAKAFFCYPTIPKKHFLESKRFIMIVSQKLSENLNMPIINTPQSATLPIKYFYNTVYHLTDRGITIRTNKLISRLKIVLN